jgi:hypothetical protein
MINFGEPKLSGPDLRPGAEAELRVTTRLVEVTEPEWVTPDPRPECAVPYAWHEDYPNHCTLSKGHPGRLTERDWCVDLEGGKAALPKPDPNPWCQAVWVKTENTNHTSLTLRIAVTCAAFDRAGNTLGYGSSEDPPTLHGTDLIVPAGKQPLQDANGDQSFFRIERVKFADVGRVNCWVSKVSKATKTYDEILSDWYRK